MKALVVGLVAVGLLGALNGNAKASERDRLEGWGPFAFGMSLPAAKEAVGTKGWVNDWGRVFYPTDIDGAPFTAVASFSQGGALDMVILNPEDALSKTSEIKCKKAADVLLKKVGESYGNNDFVKAEMIGQVKFTHTVFKFGNGAAIIHDYAWIADMKDCANQIKYIAPQAPPPKHKL